jgi:predicted esterase
VAAGLAGGAAACSSSTKGGAVGDAGPRPAALMPVLPCTDSIASVYADPGDVSSLPKGAVLRCAHDGDLTASALLAAARATGEGGEAPPPWKPAPPYGGHPFPSGARIYRVLYRTERGDPQRTPGYSSALVLLPDTPRADALPVVVASHGSRGQAARCAPSLQDPAAWDVNPDFIHQVYPLVGFGYAVIAPDLAGYANFGGANNPPSAYADALDVGKSTLDAVAALRHVLPAASLTQQIALTGHSQGGHTALSALALSGSYPVSGTIAAVAVYSPLWFSQHAWASIFLLPQTFGFAQNSAGVVSLWYHATHATLLDGPDAGADGIFDPAKLETLRSFVESDCWTESYPDLVDAGASANDFFTPAYVSALGTPSSPFGSGCKGDPVCTTWLARMTADWPHLTGPAAKTPILVVYANDDTTITPDVMQCVYNRLSVDGANYRVCYDPDPVGHAGVVSENSEYVVDWIAQQTLGGPAPTEACGALHPNAAGVPQLVGDAGAVRCNGQLSTQ